MEGGGGGKGRGRGGEGGVRIRRGREGREEGCWAGEERGKDGMEGREEKERERKGEG